MASIFVIYHFCFWWFSVFTIFTIFSISYDGFWYDLAFWIFYCYCVGSIVVVFYFNCWCFSVFSVFTWFSLITFFSFWCYDCIRSIIGVINSKTSIVIDNSFLDRFKVIPYYLISTILHYFPRNFSPIFSTHLYKIWFCKIWDFFRVDMLIKYFSTFYLTFLKNFNLSSYNCWIFLIYSIIFLSFFDHFI